MQRKQKKSTLFTYNADFIVLHIVYSPWCKFKIILFLISQMKMFFKENFCVEMLSSKPFILNILNFNRKYLPISAAFQFSLYIQNGDTWRSRGNRTTRIRLPNGCPSERIPCLVLTWLTFSWQEVFYTADMLTNQPQAAASYQHATKPQLVCLQCHTGRRGLSLTHYLH